MALPNITYLDSPRTETELRNGFFGPILTEIDAKEPADSTILKESDFSSQAQAEAGTDNATVMTPLRTAQAIAAIGGGGGMFEFVATSSVAAGSGISFTSLSQGRYRVLFEGVFGSNQTPIRLLAIDNTVLTAANYRYSNNLAAAVTGQSFIRLSAKSTAISAGVSGFVDIDLGQQSGAWFSAYWDLNYAANHEIGAGVYDSATIQADGFRFQPESGTITGTFHLYKYPII